ncbi:MAG: prepilin-type N-terminal cleavage/methylation domain-containing protein [bacterium]|nr:prepilin-type N-terminal cleavage/methylation domain-containing protein [bacterium]
MKNKGFTLIELLAVIVILAIIALIATPIIIGIINDARNSARERSAELVKTGIQYAYTKSMYKGTNGTQVGTVSLQSIHDYFDVDNAHAEAVSGDSLTIKTDDDVICTLTYNAATGKYLLNCGVEGNLTKYYNGVDAFGAGSSVTSTATN